MVVRVICNHFIGVRLLVVAPTAVRTGLAHLCLAMLSSEKRENAPKSMSAPHKKVFGTSPLGANSKVLIFLEKKLKRSENY